MSSNNTLISVENLKVYYPITGTGLLRRKVGDVRAVDGVSFSIKKGETLGLVGESGSGKTTIGRSILRVTKITDGKITYHNNGESVLLSELEGSDMRYFRRHMQLIFQDPYSSLNPRMTVRDIIAEPLTANRIVPKEDIEGMVHTTAMRCKLNIEHLRRFPHAFSGGQRQRICIARALVSNTEFIVCDESVSALDVSIQAEILNLLMDLQQDLQLTLLFIAHDLSVVAHISDRVAVMYVGQFVELMTTEDLFRNPKHPYTEALLSAIPDVDPDIDIKPISLEGEIPNPANPPAGCRFHTRCLYTQEKCRVEEPEWRMVEDNHFVACHFSEELVLKGIDLD